MFPRGHMGPQSVGNVPKPSSLSPLVPLGNAHRAHVARLRATLASSCDVCVFFVCLIHSLRIHFPFRFSGPVFFVCLFGCSVTHPTTPGWTAGVAKRMPSTSFRLLTPRRLGNVGGRMCFVEIAFSPLWFTLMSQM